uniref:Nicotinic acetylcholine receptor a6 subunit isoform XIX n=1 Tax=Tribolium castaneum TaxID=7070 RepID=C3TS47_TRICA|nr:nicotinic acetylcholine receptor a6 subunit isoform XIX [Tribolium castaneum]
MVRSEQALALLATAFLLFIMPPGSQQGPHEKRLLNNLLGPYNVLERPVANESEPLEVKFGLTLQQIIDVDEKNQLLITNIWLSLLDLVLNSESGGDLSDFITNGEWYLIGMPGKKNTIVYACCPEPYVDVTFTIKIRRRTLYYFFNLIVPCVLISSMALLGFTLPPDSGEKLTLGVTILLSLTVFLNLVAETLPQVSDAIPLLGTYFNCIMFMVASSVVLTVVVLNYHHRTADIHEMPQWIKTVFLQWLPWMLGMSRPGKKITRKTILMNSRMKELELKERSSKSLLANVLDIDDDFRNVSTGGNNASMTTSLGGTFMRHPTTIEEAAVPSSGTQRDLQNILRELQFITNRMKKADEEAEVISDWKFAAMVVDRFCLIIFTMFTIIATVAVLLSAPHIIVQ